MSASGKLINAVFPRLSGLGDGGWSGDPSFLMALRKFIDFNFDELFFLGGLE